MKGRRGVVGKTEGGYGQWGKQGLWALAAAAGCCSVLVGMLGTQ
jgi:hypothetical protein